MKKKILDQDLGKRINKFSRDQKRSETKTNKIINKDLGLINKDSERRKLAEQRATRRVKGQIVEEKVIKRQIKC